MHDILNTTIIGLFFGTLGTTLGGIIGAFLNSKSDKLLGFILEFAAGLMLAIVSFELLPEAMNLSSIPVVIIGVIIGVVVMIFCDHIVNYKYERKYKVLPNSLIKTGIIVGIGLAIHNFPEGLAIGSGFSASTKLGITLAIAIALHDVPEGISMSIPMKKGGMKKRKVVILTFLSGITTGLGVFFRSINRRHFRKVNKFMFVFCSRCNALYSNRRINPRI